MGILVSILATGPRHAGLADDPGRKKHGNDQGSIRRAVLAAVKTWPAQDGIDSKKKALMFPPRTAA